ncbi:histidine kinase [Nonomuraea salmonea]|uniref:histidine kinase n=1 Tax=Nonomuraea salmonea TaxID=46181 RepID=A0ABV5NJJ3_9ACTN
MSEGVVRRATGAVVRPLKLALYRGDADAPPARRRLTFRMPQWLWPVIPARTVNLVQVADLVLAFALYGLTVSMMLDWNAEAALLRPHGGTRVPILDAYAYLAALGVALPVALRDRWPLAAWRVAAGAMPLVVWVDGSLDSGPPPYPWTTVVGYLMVLYSVAVRCERRITVGVWMVAMLAAWIIHPDSMPLTGVFVTIAAAFGYNVRVRRSATAKLVEEEQRVKAAESAQAVLEERARIARELHDVVAHHMSVIAIQAEAVPLKAAGDPAQLEAGLAEIRGLSLEAIAQLRQVLGVLRDPAGRADTAPQPGLDRVDELIANARAAGLAVLVRRSGELSGLPSAVELSAYRIVQESLSNVMRHAPGAAVAVDITRTADTLHLTIANGPTPARAATPRNPPAIEAGTPHEPMSQGEPHGAMSGSRSAPNGTGALEDASGRGLLGSRGDAGKAVSLDDPGGRSGRANTGDPIRIHDLSDAAGGGHGLGGGHGRGDGGSGGGDSQGGMADTGGLGRTRGLSDTRGLGEPGGGGGLGDVGGLGRTGAAGDAHGGDGPGGEVGRVPVSGSGQGLVGMLERAVLLGGTLEAGPVPGGGFEVRATLPITGRESA